MGERSKLIKCTIQILSIEIKMDGMPGSQSTCINYKILIMSVNPDNLGHRQALLHFGRFSPLRHIFRNHLVRPADLRAIEDIG